MLVYFTDSLNAWTSAPRGDFAAHPLAVAGRGCGGVGTVGRSRPDAATPERQKYAPPGRRFCAVLILLVALLSSPGFAVDFTSSNLPIIDIRTDGEPIPDEPKIEAWMGVIDKGPEQRNHIGDPFNGYVGNIGIEVRGSSSQSFPKKSYALETRTADGENLDVELLGMPPENDWVLYAPYSDKSLMRNALACWIARQMQPYASRTRFCEVVLNGDYQGIYVLMEKIKRDKNRVDISTLREEDSAGDELTGGYIIRFDRFVAGQTAGWYSAYSFAALPRLFYQYHYPRASTITLEQEMYIQGFFNQLEDILAGRQFSDSEQGYARYIDVASFVDHIIINEVAKNVDAYRLSTFMYKDKDSIDGRLVMGPIWDFNLAFGNINYNVHPSAEMREDPRHEVQINNRIVWGSVPFWIWWRRILQDEAFIAALEERWQVLRGDFLQRAGIDAKIDSMALHLEEAQARNFARWPVLGEWVWPNYFVGQTYAEEVEYLKEWLAGRLAWLDGNFIAGIRLVADLPPDDIVFTYAAETPVVPSFALGQNYPNPFNGRTTIRFAVATRTPVDLSIYNLNGQKVATLVEGVRKAGEYTVDWDGMDRAGNELAAGIYLYRINSGSFRKVEKMLLLK